MESLNPGQSNRENSTQSDELIRVWQNHIDNFNLGRKTYDLHPSHKVTNEPGSNKSQALFTLRDNKITCLYCGWNYADTKSGKSS